MAETIAFGPFVLDPSRGELLRDGNPVAINQRGILLLKSLLQANGQPVTKATLMDAAWPGVIVEEGNLTVQIAALRKLLGSSADGREWISTVPRVGYRLHQISAQPAAVDHFGWPSLAVLPFQNLSGDTEQEYFADGVVGDIITALSRFKDFAVIARNSSFAFKGRNVDVRQVSKDLGVRYVLEGSVRRAGNTLRISAQLIDGTTGANLWAQNFDGSIDDIFAFQDRITESVVWVVEPNIRQAEIERSRRERPQSHESYDLYLKALTNRWVAPTVESTAAMRGLLDQALAIEPSNGNYLALAAWAIGAPVSAGRMQFEPETRRKCMEYVEHALRFANEDAMVLSSCANVLTQMLHDYERGIELAHLAIEANPNDLNAVNVAGVTALHFGNLDHAIQYFERAIRLNPRETRAPWPLTGIAHAEMSRGNFAEALRWAEKSFAQNSQYGFTYWMLIAANAQLGRMDEARSWLAKFRAYAPSVTLNKIRVGQPSKDPSRMAAILEGLKLAGLPEE